MSNESFLPATHSEELSHAIPVPFAPRAYLRPATDPSRPDGGKNETLRLLGILRRNIWILVSCVVLGLVAGWAVTWRAAPMYEATASLRITEGETSLPELDALKVLGGGQTEVNTELEVLRSRTLVGRVVDDLGLQLAALSPRNHPRSVLVRDVTVAPNALPGLYSATRAANTWIVTSPDGMHTEVARTDPTVALPGLRFTIAVRDSVDQFTLKVLSREEAIRATARALRVTRPTRDANILTVTWRGSDPTLVAAVPNGLVSAFIVRRVSTRKAGARSTVAFLNSQIDTLASELKDAEASLRAYREATGVVSFDEQAKLSVGKLASLQADRSALSAELSSLEGTLRDIQSRPRQVAEVSAWRQLLAFPTLLRIPSLASLLDRLNALEGARSDLLVRRTTKDPDVIAASSEIEGLESQVRSLALTYMEGLRQQVSALDQTLRLNQTQLRQIPEQEVKLAELQRRTHVLGDLFTLLQTKRKEAEIAEAIEDPSAQIVDYAQVPEKPIAPILSRNVAVFLVLALIFGFVVAYTRDAFDTKLHTSEELREITGVPVLGIIPHFSGNGTAQLPDSRLRRLTGRRSVPVVAQAGTPHATVHEAFKALRVNIAFSSAVRPPKLLLVTSAFPGDGKSSSVANLARAMAEQRLRVLVVDADMRRGALNKNFQSTRAPGLSELLVGRADLGEVTQRITFDSSAEIDFISTGTIPPNPAELLGGIRFTSFVQEIEGRYDSVLFDSPPVNSVSDPLLIAAVVDGVILVARGGKTDRAALRFAQDQLLHVRAKILGAVLNDYDVRLAAYYGGYYGRDYGQSYGPNPPPLDV